jgi:hypothetical protein
LSGTLTIPNSVTDIGSDAFADCKFTGLEVAEGNTSFKLASHGSVGDICYILLPKAGHTNNDFDYANDRPAGCLAVGDLTIPATGVTSIGESAFSYCGGLSGTLTIPNSVTSIGERAFYKCSGFTGDAIINFQNGITTYIGIYAFAGESTEATMQITRLLFTDLTAAGTG